MVVPTGAGLVAASPQGPVQVVGQVVHGAGEQVEQSLDLVQLLERTFVTHEHLGYASGRTEPTGERGCPASYQSCVSSAESEPGHSSG